MKSIVRLVVVAFLVVLAACSGSSSPGPLEGTWSMDGTVPMTVTFRSGETEAMGMIEKVSYKTEGNDVLVTNLDGIAKGTTFRYTMTGPDTARSELGILRRIK